MVSYVPAGWPSAVHPPLPGERRRVAVGHPPKARLDEVSGLLRGLLIRLDDRLPSKAVDDIALYIHMAEPGLALESMADVLSDHETSVAMNDARNVRRTRTPSDVTIRGRHLSRPRGERAPIPPIIRIRCDERQDRQ
jgi:hypothetical protein